MNAGDFIIPKTIHPTTPQVIDNILMELHKGKPEVYFPIWMRAFKALLNEPGFNDSESKRTLDIMLKNKLVRIVNQNTSKNDIKAYYILITEKGLVIKDSGGWVKYLDKPSFWKVTILNVTTVGASIATVAGVVLAIILAVKVDTVKTLESEKKELEGIIQKRENQIDSLNHLLENQKADSLDKK